MADSPFRNQPIRQLSLVVTICGALAGLILSAAGVYGLFSAATAGTPTLLLVAGLTLLTITFFLHAILDVALQVDHGVNRLRVAAEDTVDALRRIEPMMKTVSINSQISDGAKSIANREIEREALRQAVREEMVTGEMEVAQYFIAEMERRFGDHAEAQKLREEMSQMREMTIDQKISEALAHIHRLMDEHRWARAAKESERLMKLFPRNERVASLPAELNSRREARKQELLKQWKLAVDREEVDRAITVLTELDQYLAKEEAQTLTDSVRHVFKARLVNLGVQFSLAASEGRWRDALEVGLQIRQEFPNSRIAKEVAAKVEVLRMRAGFGADADMVVHRRETAQQPQPSPASQPPVPAPPAEQK
ncbi:MAG TPA: hypothetical protein VLM89_17630 [Phycisphaerae bacterium]|nr:hypothetical protein [Phycisphaerae bacterium]